MILRLGHELNLPYRKRTSCLTIYDVMIHISLPGVIFHVLDLVSVPKMEAEGFQNPIEPKLASPLVQLPTSGCRTGTYSQYLAYARDSFLGRRTRADNLYDLRNLGLITAPNCLEQCFQKCLLPITFP